MKITSLLLALLSLVLPLTLGACRRPVGAPLPRAVACDRNVSVGLGARDVISISVFNEAALSGDFRIGEDGTIDYPYLGRIEVRGLQSSAVAERIRVGLGPRSSENPTGHDVLREPSVRVETREINSRRISVFGQVQHPGVFPHQQCLTLTQAIALAGGFTALAETNQVRVTGRDRNDPSGRIRRTYVLRAEDIATGRAADFFIEPDDVIFVTTSIT